MKHEQLSRTVLIVPDVRDSSRGLPATLGFCLGTIVGFLACVWVLIGVVK